MKKSSMSIDEEYPGLPSSLSEEGKLLYLLLIESKVPEDQLVGTMLLLKDTEEDMRKMILYIWHNEPTAEEINNLLVKIIKQRPKSQRSGKVSPST